MVGYSREELTGRTWVSLTHADDLDGDLDNLVRLRTGEIHGFTREKRYLHRDGHTVWVNVKVSAEGGDDGQPHALIAIVEDITERRRAEQAYQASEQRFQTLFARANVGVTQWDAATGALLVANPKFCELTGYGELEIVGKTWQEFRFPEDLEEGARHVEELVEERATLEVELRCRRKDGLEVWVAVTGSPLWAEGEAPTSSVTVMRDITESRVTEASLRESEERYRSLVENLDDVVFSSDLAGNVTFVSSAVAQFGFTQAIVGQSIARFIHPDDLPLVVANRQEVITTGAPRASEFRMYDAAGRQRFVRTSARRVMEHGRVVGITAVLTDLTEQRETVEQLQFAQKMEAVGRLAGGVAHDFNNLLSVISSYTELAIEAVHEGDPLRTDLEEIRLAGVRAAALTRQLLAFSRKQLLVPKLVDLNVIIAGMKNMLGRLIGEDVNLVIQAARGLGTTKVDPGQVEQVLMNLAVNARDAMPRGGKLTISTANLEIGPEAALDPVGPEPGSYVALIVSDTGCGMDAATRARVFEPFFTTKAVGKGTGLGLATVYGIVKQSGGAILVDSEPGAGATFTIYLRREVDSVAADSDEMFPPPVSTGTETILVVEDDASVRNLVIRVLGSAGYHVFAAATPAQALALPELQFSELQLILTDVVMPGMSGKEMAERMSPLGYAGPVLYMSGYSDDEIAHRGVLAPNIEFLGKPFTPERLSREVRRVLDGAQRLRS